MLWNLGLFTLLQFYKKKKAFDGEIFLLYLFGYGAGRFWIEWLRTDQLKLFGTGIAASQALSAVLVFFSAGMMVWFRFKKKTKEL